MCALPSLREAVATAQQGESESIFAAARTAVGKGEVERSKQVGSSTKTAFTDSPFNGGVLIGFEIGLGKAGKDEVIHCLRALYSTPDGETPSPDFGQFFDKILPNGKVQKTKVTRAVRVQADPGYAVAGVTLRTRMGISGMQVTFHRLKGQQLDPKQSYTSDWIGDPKGNGQAIMSKGSPALGIFGNVDEAQILALGLIWFKQAEPAQAAAARVKQPAEQRKVPPEPAKAPPVAEQQQPAAPPAKAPVQPRAEPKPPVPEPEPPPVEPEPPADNGQAPAPIARERDSLWLSISDVVNASIEPISFWRKLRTENCVALLHVEHRERGPITLELPTPLEARMAMEYLTPLLGERLLSGVVWDKKKQRLVHKPQTASI
jgi:hypothetical protein